MNVGIPKTPGITTQKENIYLFISKRLNPTTAGSARINAKERQGRRAKGKKGVEAQVKYPTLIQAIDAFIGDEKQNEKQEKRTKRNGADPKPSYPGPFGCLLCHAGIIQ